MKPKSRRSQIIEMINSGMSDQDIMVVLDREYPPGEKNSTSNRQALAGTKWDLKRNAITPSRERPTAPFTLQSLQLEVTAMVLGVADFVGRHLDLNAAAQIVSDEDVLGHVKNGQLHAVSELPSPARADVRHIGVMHQFNHLYELAFENRFDLCGTTVQWTRQATSFVKDADEFWVASSAMLGAASADDMESEEERTKAQEAASRLFSFDPSVRYWRAAQTLNVASAKLKLALGAAMTFKEFALVAQLNPRTITNLAASRAAGLSFYKQDDELMIDVAKSQEWIKRRSEFTPTVVYDSYPTEIAQVADAMRREIARRDITVSMYAQERYEETYWEELREFLAEGKVPKLEHPADADSYFTIDVERDVLDNYADLPCRAHFLWASRQRNYFG